ncbi:MAG: trypsin-like peptidase domain-containing protein [Betaproteobacteria bacterium]|nr:trypsin-like peptidase domain-containing protein [Betaproteobacteria bacterium]
MKPGRTLLLGGGALVLLLVDAALVLLSIQSSAPVSRPVPAPAPEQVFSQASQSVAMVYAVEPTGRITGRGSGVFLERGVLLTNCHVIARGTTFLAGYRQKRSPARLVAYDADRDLCALHVGGLDVVPARIGDAWSVQVGQRVYAIGTPEGFELTLSEGVISGLREAPAGRYLQTTAALSEGSSGGGLFDSEGRLIGIAAFVYSAGQSLNFAAPVNWAVGLASRASGGAASTESVELPPALKKEWRPPLLK